MKDWRGTTRTGIRNWEPPEDLPHGVEILARAAQKLVAAVDVAHILDEEGNVKPEWRQKLTAYLKQVTRDVVQRKATSLILGCTHFEYFERDFARLLPTLAARSAIISPSGALACTLIDAYQAFVAENPIRPVAHQSRSYFTFSGERPPDAIFKSLGLQRSPLQNLYSGDRDQAKSEGNLRIASFGQVLLVPPTP
jgi:hypothetical protein